MGTFSCMNDVPCSLEASGCLLGLGGRGGEGVGDAADEDVVLVLVCVEGLFRNRGERTGLLAGEVGVVMMGEARSGRLLCNMVSCCSSV